LHNNHVIGSAAVSRIWIWSQDNNFERSWVKVASVGWSPSRNGGSFLFSTCVAGIVLLPSIGSDLLDEATREITTTGRNYLMSADMTKAHAAYQDFLSL
jgi:hypothetical protein